MLILITLQEPGLVRTRFIVSAPSTFDAIAKLMDNKTDPNTYIAARPATAQDVDQHGICS